jgi:Ca2+-binding RTX toxin-like protein
LGNLKEWLFGKVFGEAPEDTWKDQYNNEIGRQIGEWADKAGLTEAAIDRLIIDAVLNGDLKLIDAIPAGPQPKPEWQGKYRFDPTGWGGPNDPFRYPDYTGIRNPDDSWFERQYKEAKRDIENIYHRFMRDLNDADHWLQRKFGFSFGEHDPLVLDLDLNGVALTSLSGSTAHFDFEMDGFAERTGWVSSGDALLVRDLNSNGLIDNGGELFGNGTEDGFTALAEFDLNTDGVINASDPIWAELKLWKDANQDGVTQAGEIVSLASENVVSIDLDAAASRESRAGNSILFTGGFTLTGGHQGEAVAVGFSTDQLNTVYQLPEGFEYDPEVFSLPNLRGYGLVPDLWVAMTLDPVLKGMVKDLVAASASFTSLQHVVGEYFLMDIVVGGFGGGAVFYPHSYNMQAFDHMLARWAGVDTGDEERVQAENIAESFMNRQADHAFGNRYFYQAFEEFAAGLGARFYAQVAELHAHAGFFHILDAIRNAVPADGLELTSEEVGVALDAAHASFVAPPPLDPDLQPYAYLLYDFKTDSLGGDVAAFIDAQLQSYAFDPAEPWAGYSEWHEARKALLEAVDPEGLVLDERHRAYTQNRDLAILEGPNAVYNEIAGGPGDDILDGDPPNSGVKSDLLLGGAGNDILRGGQGDDTYLFSDGSGADTISDTVGKDEIAFQGGLDSTLARYSFANGNRQDLLISFDGRSETVTVIGYFSASGSATIERITFPDGPQTSGRPVRDGVFASVATAGDDVVTGFAVATTLVGLAGADTLTGRGGDDRLVGGTGDDLLSGGGGDDTYVFAAGDGEDVIRDYSDGFNGWGGTDTLEFGAGIAPGDVVVTAASGGHDLVLSIAGTADRVTLDNDVNDSDYRIERVVFADGTVWTHAQLMAMVLAPTAGADVLRGSYDGEEISGGAGDDTIEGRGGDDVIIGGPGTDLLSGSGGNDVYRFARGDGADTIREYTDAFNGTGGTDVVEFAEGIAPADVIVSQADSGWSLRLAIAGSADSLKLESSANDGKFRVELVRFADGTVWTHADVMALATAPTAGNDSIWGGYEAETLSGGGGDDVIDGRNGNDVLTGGTGNDLLYGSGGNDTYVFARGDGIDTVREYIDGFSGWGGTDTIQFAAGVAPADVAVSQADGGRDLVLTISGTTDKIVIDGGLGGGTNYRVEQVRFADGTLWTWSELVNRSTGATAGGDSIAGDSNANVLYGLDGDDTLDGRQHNDILIGGPGNDLLIGSSGNDTYRFARGDGADMVCEYQSTLGGYGGTDTVEFAEDIAPSDIVVTESSGGGDLILTLAGTGDSVRIDGTINDSKNRVERVLFADGTIWTHAQMLAMATAPTAGNDNFWGGYDPETISGGAGNDVIDGRGGDDVLAGNSGNDTLHGSGGDDIYLYARGDGFDIVADYIDGFSGWGGYDRMQFAAGIAPADVSVGKSSGGGSYILYLDGGTGTVTLQSAVTGGSNYAIEEVRFADGTVWAKADLEARVAPGTNGADTLAGDGGANSLRGLGGNDRLTGGEGSDLLRGDSGDDVLIGDFAGYDVLASGASLLVNGSFEQAGATFTSASWGRSMAVLPGWSRSNSQTYEVMVSGYGGVAATDGSYWLDLESGGGAGSNMVVSQVVSGLAAGQVMILTFEHANRTTAASGGFELWWNNDLVLAVTSTGKTMLSKSLELVALAGDNVVTFKGLGTTDGPGASIDNVRLFATQAAAAGQDVLDGGEGNDLIDGGAGADVLSGGMGADVFRFDRGDTGPGAAADRITDFLSGADRIDLSAVDSDSMSAGNQAFVFIGADAFGGIAGQLRYRFDGTDTWVQADVDGDGGADFEIVLSGSVVPVGADFVL